MRGSILVEQAYAQGKMLDHSSWRLQRNITPSDVDLVVDSNGACLFAELSSQNQEWCQLRSGQRRLHEALIRGGPHISALCFHTVSATNQINTVSDITSFQLMLWDHKVIILEIWDGERWPSFVEKFVADPLRSRHMLISWSLK